MKQNQNTQETRLLPNHILIDQRPNNEDLILNQKFTYQFFLNNRYKISQNGIYESLCNNGFIKLYTKQCRVYWYAQNQINHEVPDWKFHISVSHKHLKTAWNLIASLFFKYKCRAGMKVIYLNEANNPQIGRQITIYIIKYDPRFKQSAFAGDFGLDIDIQHSQEYWFEFCRQIQSLLSSYDIESNGLAEGDLAIGKYISLRNQAFVRNEKNQSIYPPNTSGWNALSYEVPINLSKFKAALQPRSKEQIASKKISVGALFLVGALVTGFWIKLKWKPSK